MAAFDYRKDELCAEEVPLSRIAADLGTPCYVYSRAQLEENFRAFDAAFAGRKHLVCYSVKANSNLSLLQLLGRMGAGADIVSGGELLRARRAGIPADRIVFSGVGKREEEIEAALREGILLFNVESHGELELLARVATRLGVRAPVSLRVNPDVDPETHPYISTGLKKNKFGVPFPEAHREYAFARSQPGLEVRGIDCHIGSQLLKTAPFRDAIARVAGLVKELAADGVRLTHVDVGGGLGITYKEGEEVPPSQAEYAAAIGEALAATGLDREAVTLLCEPGRSIVGTAGVLLTRVLYLKQGETKRFCIVDAAFNDLMRPALYGSYHALRPVVRRPAASQAVYDVVGPICETGDFFARDREIAEPRPGDLLAVMCAGAYGASMSSNYNTRPRAAEVLVEGDSYRVVRRRETLEDLLRGEELAR